MVKTQRIFAFYLFFFYFVLVGWNLPLQTVYLETTTPPQQQRLDLHTLPAPFWCITFLICASLCLHSEGSTNLDGLFLERNKPSKKMNSSSKLPDRAGAAGAAGAAVAECQRDSVGFVKTKRTPSKNKRKICFSIFAQWTSGCRDSPCKYLCGCRCG